MPLAESDRRTSLPRAEVRTTVELTVDDLTVPTTMCTANVSLGGMFVVMAVPRPVGSQARFRMYLPSGEEVTGLATVVWIRTRTVSLQQPSGAGFQFNRLQGQSRSLLAELINSILEEKWRTEVQREERSQARPPVWADGTAMVAGMELLDPERPPVRETKAKIA